MKKDIIRYFGLIFPYLLILASIVGLTIAVLLQRYVFLMVGLLLAIPIIAVSLLLLNCRKKLFEIELSDSIKITNIRQNILYKTFILVLLFSIIEFCILPLNSLLFFITIVILYCLIFLQILGESPKSSLILIEIILTLVTIILQTTIKSPYYFGSIDILSHVYLANVTLQIGNIIPQDLGYGYSFFPLYHVWLASCANVLNINIITVQFFITGPIYAISVIFIYYIFSRVLNNQKISLMACLLFSIDSTVIFYGTYVITRTMAFFGFIILLYLFYNNKNRINNEQRIAFFCFILIISIFIVLVHQVSILHIILLLIILFICEWINGKENYLRTKIFLFEIIFFLSYWFFTAFSFVSGAIIPRLETQIIENPIIIETTHKYSMLEFFINNIGYQIFIFFALIGIGYILWQKRSSYFLVFGLFSLVTMIFYIPTPLQTLWQTMTVFRLERIVLLIAPFMAFIMGVGIFVMLESAKTKKVYGMICILLFLVFFAYCCKSAGIISINVSPEQRSSFSSEELISLSKIKNLIPYGSSVYSDYYTYNYFSEYEFSLSKIMGFPYYNSTNIQAISDIPSYNGFIVIPYHQFIDHGLALQKGTDLQSEGGLYPFLPSNETILALDNNLYNSNKLFNSYGIDMYFAL